MQLHWNVARHAMSRLTSGETYLLHVSGRCEDAMLRWCSSVVFSRSTAVGATRHMKDVKAGISDVALGLLGLLGLLANVRLTAVVAWMAGQKDGTGLLSAYTTRTGDAPNPTSHRR